MQRAYNIFSFLLLLFLLFKFFDGEYLIEQTHHSYENLLKNIIKAQELGYAEEVSGELIFQIETSKIRHIEEVIALDTRVKVVIGSKGKAGADVAPSGDSEGGSEN